MSVGAVWMFRQALNQVDALLARPLWAEQGQVTAELWVMPGLGVDSDDLAGSLERAGYSRVQSPDQSGDFSADAKRIFVRDGDVDVLVTFKDGAISTVSPQRKHRFRATEARGTGTSAERRQPITCLNCPSMFLWRSWRWRTHGSFSIQESMRGGSAALMVNIIGDGYRQGARRLHSSWRRTSS